VVVGHVFLALHRQAIIPVSSRLLSTTSGRGEHHET
jgi:hypothetical protein